VPVAGCIDCRGSIEIPRSSPISQKDHRGRSGISRGSSSGDVVPGHNMWQSYRTRKERKLELKSDPHAYETKGNHLIMVKVIDIFGNDTTKVLEVKS